MTEENKDLNYKALRRAQTTLKSEAPAWEPGLGALDWVFPALPEKTEGCSRDAAGSERDEQNRETDLPELLLTIVKALREQERLTIAQLPQITGSNRNTLKVRLRELAAKGRIRRHVKARGTWYSSR